MRLRSVRSAAVFLSIVGAFLEAALAQSPPAFSSQRAAVAVENATDRIFRPFARDADGDPVTISISGGADARHFRLGSGGYLRFKTAPDYENPRDADRNNRYELALQASDGRFVSYRKLTIWVRNAADGGPGGALRVRRIALGFDQPVFLLGRGDRTDRAFVVEKTGKIQILNLATGAVSATPFIDIGATIVSDGERGLLGMALAPDFAASGVFYVNVTNLAGDSEIRRYRRSATDPEIADPASGDIILRVAQPAANHNGGWIGFGIDRLLYIALGDGGGANDPFGNGQNRNTLLAKVLRIDPSADAFPADPLRDYAIPSENPFARGGGAPETFAWGLRNPFRCSIDGVTGRLFIGDVGQGAREEIDFAAFGEGGLNFGWPILEGTRVNASGSTAGLVAPAAEYNHGSGAREGDSVTGGYVYRGPVIALWGHYIFGDFISGAIWSVPASAIARGATIPSSSFAVRTLAFTPDVGFIDQISSFGEDDQGNLYIVGLDGDIFKIEAQ